MGIIRYDNYAMVIQEMFVDFPWIEAIETSLKDWALV
jgi:hypothetical protein